MTCYILVDSSSSASEAEAFFIMYEEPMSAVDQEKSPEFANVLARVSEEFVDSFLLQQAPAVSDTEGRSSKSSSSGCSSRPTKPPTRAPTSTAAQLCPSHGPKRNRWSSNEEDEDSRRRKKPSPSQNWPLDGEPRLLASPCTKFGPRRYSERSFTEENYRGWSSCYLRDIPCLKQHLYRVHRRPEHYCPYCFSPFLSGEQLELHIVQRSCLTISSPFAERMTPDQVTAIKRRELGKSRLDAWFDIYAILFPRDPYIDSVYSEPVQDFLTFLEREAPPILANEINTCLFRHA